MRVLVVGAGPIGSYLAAAFARSGAEVSLYGRGERFASTQRTGSLALATRAAPAQVEVLRVHCTSTPPPVDLGFEVLVLAVKAHDLGPVAETFARHARHATTVLPQNGLPWWQFLGTQSPPLRLPSVDPGGRIEAALPLARIAGCVVNKGITIRDDGVVLTAEVPASDRFYLGDVVAGAGVAAPVVEWLRRGNLPAHETPDIRTEKWRKLLTNVAFNPLGAISHLGFGEVLDLPEGESLARALMNEALTVAHACGLRAPIDSESAFVRARSSRHHKTSMLQDVEAGRTPEIQAILGVLGDLARHHALQVPTLDAVCACMRLVGLALRKGPIRQVAAVERDAAQEMR